MRSGIVKGEFYITIFRLQKTIIPFKWYGNAVYLFHKPPDRRISKYTWTKKKFITYSTKLCSIFTLAEMKVSLKFFHGI